MAKRTNLSLEIKAKIVALNQQNLSNREISRQIGCCEGSVRYVLKNYLKSGSLLRKRGSGRKEAISGRDARHLKTLSLRNRFASAPELKRDLEDHTGVKCSVRTVQRKLNAMGLVARRPAKKPLLTSKMRKARLEWARERASWTALDWGNVIFSDESKFNLIGPDGRTTVRRRLGERYSDECIVPTVKHSPSVMVWGCITSRGVGSILLLQGSVNAEKYIRIIDEGLIPTIEEVSAHGTETIFQDDSAPCHRAKSVTVYKDSLGIKSLPWPGNSPDLNPIENLWAILGKKLREKKPKNIEELKNFICKVWYEEINPKYLEGLYNSMPKRIAAVINAKGGATKY